MVKRPCVVITLLALLLSGCTSQEQRSSGSARDGGPLREPEAHGMIVREPVGARFTDGFEVLDLGGDEPAVIRRITSVGGEATIEQLGAMIAGPARRYAAEQLIVGFPPQRPQLGTLQDAAGFTILPRAKTRERLGYELLLGYRAKADRIGVRTELVVEYEVAGELYRRSLPAGLVYCPPRFSDEECSDVAHEAFPQPGA